MSLSFTRREFYDLVWSKPMIHLAKELGVSDVALHKICRKHDIPNPPLGWWAKKAAGKAVEQIPLPEIESDRPAAIYIRNAPAADWKTQAIEAAEGKAKSAPQSSAAIPKRGSVIVRNTLAALRRGKANEQARLYEEQRQRREREARLKYIEERRSDELALLLDTQSRLEKLETLLALAHNEPGENIDSRVREFRHWLHGQINETRALLTPAGLEGRFSELNLFGHDDDRDFSPRGL